jgi:two-component sensor histidine kinase
MNGWKAYAVAILLCLISAFFRVYFDEHLIGATYLPFFPALIVGTYIGGFWPGVVSSVMIGLVNLYFFMPPANSFKLDISATITLGFYSLIALFVVWSIHTLRGTLLLVDQNRRRADEIATKRERLLRELQHRVKNNLQLVSSLLILQKSKARDKLAQRGLEEASRRVSILSSIHHDLYRLDGTRVNPADLIQRVVDFAQSDLPSDAAITCDLADTPMSPREAIPFGLIVNELIANAVEHGSAAGSGIRVTYRIDGTVHTFQVSDDGPGLPPGFDPEHPETLGLTIVQALSAQMNAQVMFRKRLRTPGTDVIVTFEPPQDEEEEVRFDSSS